MTTPIHHRPTDARLPGEPVALPPQIPAGLAGRDAEELDASARRICRIVQEMTEEMLRLACDRVTMRRDRRRAAVHVRQIAMYVCHVALGFSQQDIGLAFGRDRTTVGYACATVEDRRDDLAFDDFVSAIERLAQSVFARQGEETHG